MRAILSTTDRSLVESARFALEAENITVMVEDTAGAALPFIPATVLVNDADYDRARILVGDLMPGAERPVQVGRWYRSIRTMLVVLAALGLILCGTIFLR